MSHKIPKTNVIEDRQLKDPIEYGLHNLSQRLGVFYHKFVTSISTSDIKNLLTQSYADVSKKTNEAHAKMAQDISRLVQEYNNDRSTHDEGHYIKRISDLVTRNAESQKDKLAAFSVVNKIITEFFASKSIKISDAITFGAGENLLDSDVLSAGEKQFLGFLTYNALLNDGAIFIDEPELSLHIDWQRN